MKVILYRNFCINPTNKTWSWSLCKGRGVSDAFYVEIPEDFEIAESNCGSLEFYGKDEKLFELCGGEKSVSLVGDEIVDLKILGKA